MNYLSAENLSLSFGDRPLFENLSFGLAKGDKTALIARNGSGKTTLLRILMGKTDPDSGEFTIRGGIKTAFLEQSPVLDESLSIDELILNVNTPVIEVIKAYEAALDDHAGQQSPDAASRLERATDEMDRLDAWDYERRLKQLLDLFRIINTERLVAKLSGGEKKRLALALVLLDTPDLLILDEPTNHLDIDMIEWLESYLSQAKLTLLMVTHDRYFLDRVCNHIIEMDNGKLFHYLGNYELFLEKRAERAMLQQTEAGKAEQLLKKELEWLRRSPKARTGKSKARIDAVEGIKERAARVYDSGELRLKVKTPRLGSKILELDSVTKEYGPIKIIDRFSYKFSKGERLGIIGRNGTGKTSFLNLIYGLESADSGTVDIGKTVVMGYYRQLGFESESAGIENDRRVIDVVKDIAEMVLMEDGKSISASLFLEHFLFTPDAQYKPVSKLSGGEIRRLNLLTVLIKNPNFLILDEPTNDLDLLALNKLEEFLLGYKGCLLIVSHDRYFLDKLSDHLFVFEGDGRITDHYGPYVDYQRKKVSRVLSKNEARPVSGKKTESKKGAEGNKIKTRLSYKEQQEYLLLEQEIEALEEEKTALENELSEGKLNYAELDKKSKRVAGLIDLIETKTDRWLELSQYSD